MAMLTETNERFPTLKEGQDMLITIALGKSGGDRQKAAQLLGISERALYTRILRRKRNNK